MIKKLAALLIALTTAFALAACGSDSSHDGHGGSDSKVPKEAGFNQADVDFATEMIQHHAQALSMVDLIEGKEVSPELTALSEQITLAQGREIEMLVDWLDDWSQPVPETMRDHANAQEHGGMEMDSEMPGMMSREDMEALEATQGAAFEDRWLRMMIEHHEGAVDMAQTEKDDGKFAHAIDLANRIITAQESEITQMKTMLGS